MTIRIGYLHYFYDNFLKKSQPVSSFYNDKQSLLRSQLALQEERMEYSTRGSQEAKDILGFLMQRPSILQYGYERMGNSLGGRDNIAIDFQNYTSMRQLAKAIQDDKTEMANFIEHIDIFADQMEEILKIMSGLQDDPMQYNAIALEAINSFVNHGNIGSINSQNFTDTIVRRLAKHQSSGDTLLKVPKGNKGKAFTAMLRAAALIEGLRAPGASQQLKSIAADPSAPDLISRIVDKLAGLLSNVYGGAGEAVSDMFLGAALNKGNNELLRANHTFAAKGMGRDTVLTVEPSAQFQEDCEILGLATNHFKKQGKGDTQITVSGKNGEAILTFSISEKQGKVNKGGTLPTSVKIVGETNFFAALGRSELYSNPGFMVALKNAAAGRDENEEATHPIALADWKKGVEAVKYGSFLQHLAGIRAGAGDKEINTLFLVVNHKKVYSISKVIKAVLNGTMEVEMTPLEQIHNRAPYVALNEWIPGEDTGSLSEERSLSASRKIYDAWRQQKISMHLYL